MVVPLTGVASLPSPWRQEKTATEPTPADRISSTRWEPPSTGVTCCWCVFNQNESSADQVSRNLFIHPSINRSDRYSEALPCCLFGISLGKWRVVWIWVAGQERENWLCDWISGSRRREFHWEGSQAARLMPPTPPTTARDGIMESQVCVDREIGTG